MFPMTITINNNEQLSAVLSVLGGPQPVRKNEAIVPDGNGGLVLKDIGDIFAPSNEVEAKKEGPKAAESAQPAASEKSTAEPTAATSGDKVYTVDDAKALTMKIVPAKGRDAAVGLLQKYGVPVAAKLAPEQIVPFCQEAEQLLAS